MSATGATGGERPLPVELYGVARSRTGRDTVVLLVPADATLGDALGKLADALPELVGPVLGRDRRSLVAGSVVSLDGQRFTRDPDELLTPGKPLLVVPASAGG